MEQISKIISKYAPDKKDAIMKEIGGKADYSGISKIVFKHTPSRGVVIMREAKSYIINQGIEGITIKSLEVLLKAVSEVYDMPIEEIKGNNKNKINTSARSTFCFTAKKLGYKRHEIAKAIGMEVSSISKSIKKTTSSTERYEMYEKLKLHLKK
jgi:chromosomal replication initiation ATPase DnaA